MSVPPLGLGPRTPDLKGRCSNQLSYEGRRGGNTPRCLASKVQRSNFGQNYETMATNRLSDSYGKSPEKSGTPQGTTNSKEQEMFDRLHALFMQVKCSHYNTKSFAAHKAFDDTFEEFEDLVDSISEQLMGYTGHRPDHFALGTVKALNAMEMGNAIVSFASDLESWATAGRYPNLENLSQEVSGVGAKLKYLATLS